MLGVSVQTLRNWDDTGELPPARRSAGGTRYYAVADLQATAPVVICPRCGIPVAMGGGARRDGA